MKGVLPKIATKESRTFVNQLLAKTLDAWMFDVENTSTNESNKIIMIVNLNDEANWAKYVIEQTGYWGSITSWVVNTVDSFAQTTIQRNHYMYASVLSINSPYHQSVLDILNPFAIKQTDDRLELINIMRGDLDKNMNSICGLASKENLSASPYIYKRGRYQLEVKINVLDDFQLQILTLMSKLVMDGICFSFPLLLYAGSYNGRKYLITEAIHGDHIASQTNLALYACYCMNYYLGVNQVNLENSLIKSKDGRSILTNFEYAPSDVFPHYFSTTIPNNYQEAKTLYMGVARLPHVWGLYFQPFNNQFATFYQNNILELEDEPDRVVIHPNKQSEEEQPTNVPSAEEVLKIQKLAEKLEAERLEKERLDEQTRIAKLEAEQAAEKLAEQVAEKLAEKLKLLREKVQMEKSDREEELKVERKEIARQYALQQKQQEAKEKEVQKLASARAASLADESNRKKRSDATIKAIKNKFAQRKTEQELLDKNLEATAKLLLEKKKSKLTEAFNILFVYQRSNQYTFQAAKNLKTRVKFGHAEVLKIIGTNGPKQMKLNIALEPDFADDKNIKPSQYNITFYFVNSPLVLLDRNLLSANNNVIIINVKNYQTKEDIFASIEGEEQLAKSQYTKTKKVQKAHVNYWCSPDVGSECSNAVNGKSVGELIGAILNDVLYYNEGPKTTQNIAHGALLVTFIGLITCNLAFDSNCINILSHSAHDALVGLFGVGTVGYVRAKDSQIWKAMLNKTL